MNNSRTKKSFFIMITSGIRQILTILLAFVSRTVFIYVLGAEYLGLNGLFSNILQILSLSELGIGTAISFYLYKPLANNDIERIKSLMYFYKNCYRIVGLSMIAIGCIIMPFLRYLVKFDSDIPVNIYIVYMLYIMNSACSYLFFAYKQMVMIANQEAYKIEKINIFFSFLNCIVDIIVLILFRNYIVYLAIKVCMVLIKNYVVSLKVDKQYPYILDKDVKKLDRMELGSIFKNVGNVTLFRVGSTLFNSTDNVIISMLLGTIVVGYYSNYYMILSQITMVVGIIVNSFSAGIGNVIAKDSKQKQYAIFKEIDFIVYFLVNIGTVCACQVFNSFMKIWLGNINNGYILTQQVVVLLSINFYMDSTTQIMNSFREGSGHFETGKLLQLVGGIVNIILSIVLGIMYGITGIFLATVISKGFITIVPFLIGISENVFAIGKYKLLIRYVKQFAVMILGMILSWYMCKFIHMTGIFGMIAEFIISCIIAVLMVLLFFYKTEEMKLFVNRIKKIKARGRK